MCKIKNLITQSQNLQKQKFSVTRNKLNQIYRLEKASL